MPWEYLYSESISTLGQTDEWFWNSEPRVVLALVNKKNETRAIEQKNLAGYIACCVWGKNPNELDGSEDKNKQDEKVPGRDMPIDENLLRSLL